MIGFRIGTGNGTTRAWVLPVKGYSGITVRVDDVEMQEGVDYEILPAAGIAGFDILVFAAAPAAATYVDADSWGETSTFQTGEALTITPGVIESGVTVEVQS